jgi:hypothetical protein
MIMPSSVEGIIYLNTESWAVSLLERGLYCWDLCYRMPQQMSEALTFETMRALRWWSWRYREKNGRLRELRRLGHRWRFSMMCRNRCISASKSNLPVERSSMHSTGELWYSSSQDRGIQPTYRSCIRQSSSSHLAKSTKRIASSIVWRLIQSLKR